MIGSTVEVFTSTGTRKGFYQSGSGDYLGCSFTLSESGCQNISLSFAKYADINKKDIVKIKVFDSSEYFFTGVIRNIPLEGSTKQDYTYSGYGLNDYFIRLNTQSQNYAATTVRAVVLDLLDTIIVPGSPITKNLSKISTLNVGITNIVFKYSSIKQALGELLNLANSDGFEYMVGVDSDGDFFFKPKNTSIISVLVVGKQIEDYQPKETYEAISKLFVLKKDGTFYGTYVSTEDIDVKEKKLTAPDIADADIDSWSNGQLSILEQETREAQIAWQIKTEDTELIEADGQLRIISNIPPSQKESVNILNYGEGSYGGSLYNGSSYGGFAYTGFNVDDRLKIRQVQYRIDSEEGYMSLQIGSLPVELDREIIAVNKNVEDLRVSIGR